MRGRNRRGPNPLTRSYESNGPDVKVRGTAQHVAEKYTQLARDAHVSGDPVMAESYLQHAEHYYRLIAAAHQAQLAIQNGTADDRDDDEDDFDTSNDRFTFRAVQPQNGQPGNGDQRSENGDGGDGGDGDDAQDRPSGERHGQDRSGQDRQPGRNDRNDRNRGRDRNERNFRSGGERNGGDRNSGDRNGGERNGGERNRERFDPNRPRRPQPELEGAEQPVLPAFLTAPVRAIPIDVPAETPVHAGEAPAFVPGQEDNEAGRSPFRARRRRRPRAGEEGGDAGDTAPVAATEQD
jgi:hypothetical protein